MATPDPRVAQWLTRWSLRPDGPLRVTGSGLLLPVRSRSGAAVLKVATVAEEVRGGRQLAWWQGQGAARVLRSEGAALLLERGMERPSLAEMARAGRDDEATAVLCAVAQALHARSASAPSEAVPLRRWFRVLLRAQPRPGSLLHRCRRAAVTRLAAAAEVRVLHGDLHHGNVLRFEGRFAAIDPKGLLGDRAFDYVALLRNPSAEVALNPVRFEARVATICRQANLTRQRLLGWTLAFAGLSALWQREDRLRPSFDLRMARLTLAVMRGQGSAPDHA